MSARDIRGINAQIQSDNHRAAAAMSRANAAYTLASASSDDGTVSVGGYSFFVDTDGGLKIRKPDGGIVALVEQV